MENLLREYLERKYHDIEGDSYRSVLPVVTLSREYGCPSKLIAQELVEVLNRKYKIISGISWKFINKEILEETAREIQLKTVDLNYLLSSGNKGILEDILTSFSPVYASNAKLKKTLHKVITGLASRGNVVMVGRGSSAILQGHPRALHVRLQAPFEWRVIEISKMKGVNSDIARKLLTDTDQKRLALIEMVYGKKYTQTIFDLVVNCERFSKIQAADLILKAMELKKLLG